MQSNTKKKLNELNVQVTTLKAQLKEQYDKVNERKRQLSLEKEEHLEDIKRMKGLYHRLKEKNVLSGKLC